MELTRTQDKLQKIKLEINDLRQQIHDKKIQIIVNNQITKDLEIHYVEKQNEF